MIAVISLTSMNQLLIVTMLHVLEMSDSKICAITERTGHEKGKRRKKGISET